MLAKINTRIIYLLGDIATWTRNAFSVIAVSVFAAGRIKENLAQSMKNATSG